MTVARSDLSGSAADPTVLAAGTTLLIGFTTPSTCHPPATSSCAD